MESHHSNSEYQYHAKKWTSEISEMIHHFSCDPTSYRLRELDFDVKAFPYLHPSGQYGVHYVRLVKVSKQQPNFGGGMYMRVG